jgi:hypothetical protein
MVYRSGPRQQSVSVSQQLDQELSYFGFRTKIWRISRGSAPGADCSAATSRDFSHVNHHFPIGLSLAAFDRLLNCCSVAASQQVFLLFIPDDVVGIMVTRFVCKAWCKISTRIADSRPRMIENNAMKYHLQSLARNGFIRLLQWYKNVLQTALPDQGEDICVGAAEGRYQN